MVFIDPYTKVETKLIASVGFRDDGTVGEIFVDGDRSGSDREAALDEQAIMTSFTLQRGVPLADLVARAKATPFGEVLRVAQELEREFGGAAVLAASSGQDRVIEGGCG